MFEDLLSEIVKEAVKPKISRAELRQDIEKFLENKIKQQSALPVPGTPVYCNLALVAEHTGIYIGDNKIVHLNGNGRIEAVTPRVFVNRLDGINPAVSIYFAAVGGKAVGTQKIADRARAMIGKRRDYNVLLDNCHQFTCGCLSGDFENPCNYFTLVQAEIWSKFGIFSWKEWDY